MREIYIVKFHLSFLCFRQINLTKERNGELLVSCKEKWAGSLWSILPGLPSANQYVLVIMDSYLTNSCWIRSTWQIQKEKIIQIKSRKRMVCKVDKMEWGYLLRGTFWGRKTLEWRNTFRSRQIKHQSKAKLLFLQVLKAVIKVKNTSELFDSSSGT